MPELRLEDIAIRAGVSRSTVSRVVNKHPSVSDSVRQHVLEIIKETGYHPNAAARTLVSQRSWTIGLVLPHSVGLFFTDPYYPHLTKGIAQACNQANYTLALFLVGSKEDEEKILPRVSRNGLIDGVLLQAGHYGDILTDHLVKSNLPLVMVGRPFHLDAVSYVDVDNVAAAYGAVKHLVRAGYQRIGTITGHLTSAVGVDRHEGYLKAIQEHCGSIDETLIVEGDFTEFGGYQAMQKLLMAQPNAVFAASDIMAVGAMRAVREAGLNVPNDVAFIGFDDLLVGSYLMDSQLTTVHQPVFEMGVQAVELLIGIIDSGIDPIQHVMMTTELIMRSSCRVR